MILRRTGRTTGVAPAGATWILALSSVVLTVLFNSAVLAEEPLRTNLDLMTGLGTRVVEDIIGKIDSEVRGVRLKVVPQGSTEEYELLEDIFTQLLENRGVATVHGEKAGDENLYEIDYKIPVFRLSYPKVYRSYLIGGKKVKREANLRVQATLLSQSGDVLWIGESAAEESDQFKHGDLSHVEEGSYEFVKPEMPNSGWGKVVEPVLVSAIIVGMVYLFFSNQSDS